MSASEENQFEQLQSARAQAAAWGLGVAGAELQLRDLRDKHVECLSDVRDLRERIEAISRGATPTQQQCAVELNNAVSGLTDALQRSDYCYALAHHQVGNVSDKVLEFSAKVDRQVARMKRTRRPRAAQQRGEFSTGSRTRRT